MKHQALFSLKDKVIIKKTSVVCCNFSLALIGLRQHSKCMDAQNYLSCCSDQLNICDSD